MVPSPAEVFGSAAATAVVIGTYASSARLARGQRTSQSLAVLSASLVGVALLAGGLVYSERMVARLGDSLNLPAPRPMEYEWKNIPAAQITERTRILAANHYVSLGRIVDYISLDGKRTSYIPTAQDVEVRDQLQAASASFSYQRESARAWLYSLLISTLTALVLGVAIGRRRGEP